MNLSPELWQEVEVVAFSQGISAEEFIVQALREKISNFKTNSTVLPPTTTPQEKQLCEKDGLLIIDSEPLNDFDVNNFLDQVREERIQGQIAW